MDQNSGESKRSIKVGGNVVGSTVIAGDQNTVKTVARVNYQQVSLPSPEDVDIKAEIDALKELLAKLDTPDARKIKNAIEDAEDELGKPDPDRDEIGKAIDRGLEYGKRAKNFAEILDALKPHITSAAAWLGANWYKILGLVGLTAA